MQSLIESGCLVSFLNINIKKTDKRSSRIFKKYHIIQIKSTENFHGKMEVYVTDDNFHSEPIIDLSNLNWH
jgi:hypothetical protein